jgi:rubrerythrin
MGNLVKKGAKVVDKSKIAPVVKKGSAEKKARKMGAMKKIKTNIVLICTQCGSPDAKWVMYGIYPQRPKPKLYCPVCLRDSV